MLAAFGVGLPGRDAWTVQPAHGQSPQQEMPQQESQDRIILRAPAAQASDPWTSAVPTEVLGKVQNFDAAKLTYSASDGTARQLDSSQIQSLQVAWENEQIATALQLFGERRYRESVSAFDQARKSGIPPWQQQLLIGYVVRAAAALNSPRTAGVLFLNLAASQPPPMAYADIPLCWTVREVEQPLAAAAGEWLTSDADEAKLLGASWQLFGPDRELAVRTLSQLQSSPNRVVADLAVAQSWRLVPPPETLAQLSRWLEFRDRMLEPLQLGPTEFLADRLQRIGETDLAVGQWMRIATLHADRYDRAHRALTAAAQSLSRENRGVEAQRIEAWIDELDGK